MENFNLTSNEVVQEMAAGALRDSPATVVIATTGFCGEEDVDGIPAGTVCFARGFVAQGRFQDSVHCYLSVHQWPEKGPA